MELIGTPIKIERIEDAKQYDGNYRVKALLVAIEERADRNGSPYCIVSLSDGKTAKKYSMKIFRTSAATLNDCLNKVCDVVFQLQDYKGNNSYNAKQIIPTDDDISEYISTSPVSPQLMYDWIVYNLHDMSDKKHNASYAPGYGYLSEMTYDIYETYKDKILIQAAGASVHHAFIGGLLYHSLRMCMLAKNIAKIYEKSIDSEILFCGAALHDIGKLYELDTDAVGTTTYTLNGNLFGHPLLGIELIDKAARKYSENIYDDDRAAFNERLMILKHTIAAHHGKREFGAIALPATPEAIALHAIDMLDSRIEIFEEEFKVMDKRAVSTNAVHTLDGVRVYKPSWVE